MCSNLWAILANQRNKYLKPFPQYCIIYYLSKVGVFWSNHMNLCLQHVMYTCTKLSPKLQVLTIRSHNFINHYSNTLFLIVFFCIVVFSLFCMIFCLQKMNNFMPKHLTTSQREPYAAYFLILLLLSFIYLKLCL